MEVIQAMPNLKASKKDLRKTVKRTERRKNVVSEVRNILKKVRTVTPDEAKKMLPKVYSVIDKAVQAGILKKNTGDRYKERAAARANKK
jgi:small subunit ribosomal protein S20